MCDQRDNLCREGGESLLSWVTLFQTSLSHACARTCVLLTWLSQVQATTAASNPAGGKGVLLLYYNTHLLEFYEDIRDHNVKVLVKAWCRI
jgi:hypothetical protein